MRVRFERFTKRSRCSTLIAAFAALSAFGWACAMPIWAQSAAQNATAAGPVFEYEVATVKPYKPGPGEGPNMIRMGIMNAPDSFSATGVTVKDLVQSAYGVQNYQVSGGPDWFGTERLEIDAKMDSAVADALKKLSADDRALMRQKMLQTLLADRFKLMIHRETKELAVYTLVIAKSGLKMQEAKPDAAPADATAARGGRGGRGGISMMGGAEGFTMNATAVPMTSLTRNLSQLLKRPVVDKTGLTGNYDVTLKFMTDEMAALVGSGVQLAVPGGSSGSGMPSAPSGDASFPTLLVAVQEQLGLKLESGKGQAEFISVEHVEKASDN